MEIAPRKEQSTGGDRSWMANVHHWDTAESVTLDGSAFLAVYADGLVPSGAVVALDTALNLAAPYDDDYDADAVAAGQQANGRDVAYGLLMSAKEVRTATPVGASVSSRGDVIESLLPANSGLDEAAKADLPLMRFRA